MDMVALDPRNAWPEPGPAHGRAARPLGGRVALVTGSTRGIGAGIAAALAQAGCDLVLNGGCTPVADGMASARRLTESFDVAAEYSPADLRRAEEAEALVAFAQARFGRVDVLVNNAGVQHVAPVEAFADERWDEVIALNLSAAFRATKAVLPGMRARGWGRIVNIASVHGLVASERKAAYVAAKHGLVGLTKVVALETANDEITCNAVCPGWVLTDLVEAQVKRIAEERGLTMEQAAEELLRAKQPMRRFTTPEGIGAMVAFLCGDAAATTTGTAIAMDGGWTSV